MLRPRVLAAGLVLVATAIGALAASPALADDALTDDNSITVSWLPQDEPAKIVPGEVTTSRFWVTNNTDEVMEVDLDAATAIPGDDGQLQVEPGADPRFASITFSPDHLSLRPDQTVEVTTRVVAPADLGPGTYLLPVVVVPDDPVSEGNIQIRRSVVALTTFQLPGRIVTDVEASLALVETPGSLVRTLPLLPPIVVGDAGEVVLGIRSDSSAGMFIYYEAIATTTGIGSVAFVDHTEGAPDDVRGAAELYFPGTGRDHPIGWTAVPLALGAVGVSATASFNPTPTTTETAVANVSFVVVSPWWLVVIAAGAAVALVHALLRVRMALRATRSRATTQGARARRRAERLEAPRPIAAIVATVLLGLAALATALLADWLVLGAVLLAAAVLLVASLVILGRDERPGYRLALWLTILGLAAVLATLGLVLATAFLDWSPAYALATAAAASGIVIAAIWLGRATLAAAARRAAEVASTPEMV